MWRHLCSKPCVQGGEGVKKSRNSATYYVNGPLVLFSKHVKGGCSNSCVHLKSWTLDLRYFACSCQSVRWVSTSAECLYFCPDCPELTFDCVDSWSGTGGCELLGSFSDGNRCLLSGPSWLRWMRQAPGYFWQCRSLEVMKLGIPVAQLLKMFGPCNVLLFTAQHIVNCVTLRSCSSDCIMPRLSK